MKLTFLGTDSVGGHCPALFASDRNTLVVQGKIVNDADALNTVQHTYAGLGPDETVVEIEPSLLRFAPLHVRIGLVTDVVRDLAREMFGRKRPAAG